MAKENNGDDNYEHTVSTATDITQSTCKNTSSVNLELSPSISGKQDGNNINTANSENGNLLLDVDKTCLNSGDIANGVQEIVEESTAADTNIAEESEEDVPGDFFDDFLKEDFMDGLDIVDDDAWDEEKLKNCIAAGEDLKTVSAENVGKIRRKKQKSSPSGDRKHKQKKKKHEDKVSEQKSKKTKDGLIIDVDEFDIRRDPEKTKRDIERDKARCEKDKEKKIISEKLSLVETGLVPPGMEMEIDIEEVKRQKERIQQNKPLRDLRDHLRTLRGSKSPNLIQKSPKRKSSSRKSPYRTSPKNKRTRSPLRISPVRRSPLRRSPLRRSPLRRISPRRSPLRDLKRSPLHRSQEHRVSRRSRSRSPYYRNRRIRHSPVYARRRGRSGSRESEREIWLKRRRSRSRTPRRKREEKKSFLQEIAEKLNETRPVVLPALQPQMHFMSGQSLQTVPGPVPAPAPVPPPNPTYFVPQSQPLPQPQQYDPYDQSFFIGTSEPLRAPGIEESLSQSLPCVGSQATFPPEILGASVRPIPQNSQKLIPQESMSNTKEEIAKLFQDKKITLSEFLAITAKPEVSSRSPVLLQEKIKVISRCQEAIKFLESNEKKYIGKLVVRPTDVYKVPKIKNKSPLMRMPPVSLSFTQPHSKVEKKTTFTSFINDLLQNIGLMKEAVVDVEMELPSTVGISTTTNKLAPLPPPITINKKMSVNEIQPPRHRFPKPNTVKLGENQLSKMVQTDVFKCESCEQRKKILYLTSAVQCGGISSSFSVSTQVSEDDFYSKIPITQSLASLTPAQLLAKSRSGQDSSILSKFGRSIDMDDFDMHPSKSTYSNRASFSRPENYNLPRYSPPSPPRFSAPLREEGLPISPYEYNNLSSLRSPFTGGGGGRGRVLQPNLPRPLDPDSRFGYNNYY